MIDLIGCVSEIILDIQEFLFRKKKRKQRAYEKKHSLPKKRMISPYQRLGIVLLITVVIASGLLILFINSFSLKNKDLEKIQQISLLLEQEKSTLGTYPDKLQGITRNNPLYQNLLVDFWDTPFYYKKVDENTFILISLGKDKTLHTKDDVK
ncbi:hypothetical protein [Tenacibaculum sp. SDUM215027]|uniref:hypothetical protein n=1 Tax=Tenacibaculum sp. SDUM215027 TaxID=3422596 RepID=UPI003D320290